MKAKKEINIKRMKVIFLVGFGLMAISAISQMIVTDPNNTAINKIQLSQMLKQLETAREQSQRLQDMKKSIDQNLEYVEKVNTQIQNIERIKSIAEDQARIFNSAFKLKSKYRSSNLKVALQAEKMTNSVLERTQRNIRELSQILSTGVFKMNDAERLELIREHKKESAEELAILYSQEITLDNYAAALAVYNDQFGSRLKK
jgi:hypothetical protein